jgi:hypothetical protein
LYRIEKTYLDWIKRFILFHGKRHPKEMGASAARSFSLAFDRPYLKAISME